MSVINQMLQDLERRQAGADERRLLPDEVRPLPAVSDTGRARRIGGWTLVIAGTGAIAWLLAAGRIDLPGLEPVVASRTDAPATLPAVPLAPSVPPAAAAAIAMAMAPAGVASRLSLDLAAPPVDSGPAVDAPALRAEAGQRAARTQETQGAERAERTERREGTERNERPPRPEARREAEPARVATRDAANLETGRLARDTAGTARNPIGAAAPAAAVSPIVAASFATGLLALAPAFAPPASVAAAPLVPALQPPVSTSAGTRPVDTSPPRIDRQEREPSARERSEAAYRRGVEAMHDGRMPVAEQALREALSLYAAHEPSRQALLGIFVQQRRSVDAEALLVDGVRQNPAQLGFAMALARLQAERGDNAAALDSLQRAAAAGRDRPEFLAFQAGLLARAGRPADAALQYQSALRLAPQNAVWWMGLGIALESDKRLAEAADAFQRARETTGLNAELTAYVDQRLRRLQR